MIRDRNCYHRRINQIEEMATQASNPTGPHPAQMVGNAFVEQYYHILHTSPDLVYRFYQDSSVRSRPGPDGKMAFVKTMDDINVVILSMDYKECKAEIKTIDAQDSYKGGVVVQVTGWLIVKDNVKRMFTQSFFLAPQDKCYFVLNDIFSTGCLTFCFCLTFVFAMSRLCPGIATQSQSKPGRMTRGENVAEPT